MFKKIHIFIHNYAVDFHDPQHFVGQNVLEYLLRNLSTEIMILNRGLHLIDNVVQSEFGLIIITIGSYLAYD